MEGKEGIRTRNFCKKKQQHHQQKELLTTPVTNLKTLPYQSKQASGKASKHLARSLPLSPKKQHFVVAKIAKQVGLEVQDLKKATRNGFKSDAVEKVKHFYYKNEICWQAPGSQYCIELTDTGEKVKRAEQIPYLLMSIKETHHIYSQEREANPIYLSKFC